MDAEGVQQGHPHRHRHQGVGPHRGPGDLPGHQPGTGEVDGLHRPGAHHHRQGRDERKGRQQGNRLRKSGDKEVFSPEASSTVKITPGGKPAGPDVPNGPGAPNGPGTPYVPGTGPVPPAHKPSGWLASTGAQALTLLGVGGALLVTGGLVLGASKRRRRTN
ncbi:LPXTG cell wall anchor domain-containing protein [Streptomyces sp. NPDC001455]|uniref:LPXTG cell wall anchor domain-containing protein n=1 Tax=Streptomyces sp. NPDC001455 TaxID=3154518 RepID=UPI003323FD44